MKLLSSEEEKSLIERLQSGDQAAREEFIKANMGLIVSVVKRFYHCTEAGLDFEDMIQEGVFGLITAMERFDCSQGNKFSTYAIWWIRQIIQRAINNKSRCIRMPSHVYDQLSKVKRAVKFFTKKFNREPDISEVEILTGFKTDKIINLLKISKRIHSLEEFIQGTEIIFSETLKSNDNFLEIICNEEINKKIAEVIKKLTDREKEVLYKRFGLETGEEQTLEMIGKKFGITRERVRQIEAKALRKLKKSKELEMLWCQ